MNLSIIIYFILSSNSPISLFGLQFFLKLFLLYLHSLISPKNCSYFLSHFCLPSSLSSSLPSNLSFSSLHFRFKSIWSYYILFPSFLQFYPILSISFLSFLFSTLSSIRSFYILFYCLLSSSPLLSSHLIICTSIPFLILFISFFPLHFLLFVDSFFFSFRLISFLLSSPLLFSSFLLFSSLLFSSFLFSIFLKFTSGLIFPLIILYSPKWPIILWNHLFNILLNIQLLLRFQIVIHILKRTKIMKY